MILQRSFLDIDFMLNFISALKIGRPAKKHIDCHQNIEEGHSIVREPVIYVLAEFVR